MKTVIAALVVTTFASIVPVVASETAPALQRGDDAAIFTVGKDAKAPAASAKAPPAKRVRVVLASPYGN